MSRSLFSETQCSYTIYILINVSVSSYNYHGAIDLSDGAIKTRRGKYFSVVFFMFTAFITFCMYVCLLAASA